MTPHSAIARTPLDHWHAAHGARFTVVDGWRLPAAYASTDQEATAAGASVGLADISAFAKVSVQGPDVPKLVQALLPDADAARPRGVASLAADGSVLACRLTEDRLLLLSATPGAMGIAERLAELSSASYVVQSDVTAAYAGLCIVGPPTEALLRRVTALDVSAEAFAMNSCAETGLAGVHAVLVRMPELSVPSVRVYVGWDVAEYVWERLMEEGRAWGVSPLGLEALQALRGTATG
jgi:sarcosine oxidase subunit alpha